MITIPAMTRRARGGVGLAWGNLPLQLLLLLLAYLGPPLTASQSPPSLEGHGNTAAANFSCIGKVIGGYYADVSTGCQMFHVCTLNEKGKAHYYTFRCLAGTVFDQETRVCERADEVDCGRSESFFYLNNDLYGPGIIPSTANIRVIDEGEVRQGTLDAVQTVDTPTTTTTTTAAPPFVFPETSFTCVDKIPGGLYADVETGCTVFHICSVEPNSGVKDNKFVCGPGTLFDQSSRTCQTAAAVDCAAAPSLYYLNDRRNLPDSTSIDLCRSRALGSPLADITTGCRHYTVCQAGAGGRLVEIRMACKKDQLFSQLQKRCIAAKKVQCAKETLSEILGLGQGLDGVEEGKRRRRRMALLLQSRRFRRAALPPLVNLVIAPGVEDARVRRALYNLAALRQWTLENARHSTFIEVYALQTDREEDHYKKKSHLEDSLPHESSGASQVYQHIQRKKRDLANNTVAEQVLLGNHTKAEETTDLTSHGNLPQTEPNPDDTQSVTGSLLHPTIVTTTIGQKTNVFSTSTVSQQRGSSTTPLIPATPPPPPVIPTTLSTTPPIPATPPPPPVIPTTLSTFTVSPIRTSLKTTSTTTVTVTPITVTVTTTIITSAKDMPVETVSTGTFGITSDTLNPTTVTTPLSRTVSSTATADLDGKMAFTSMPEVTSANPDDESGSHNTKTTETEALTAPPSTSPEESSEISTVQSPILSNEELQETLGDSVTESASNGIAEPKELLTTTSEPLTSTVIPTNSSKNSQTIATTEAVVSPEASISIVTHTSTETTELENTTETLNSLSTTASTNATTTLSTTESSSNIMAPSGSINVSTTGIPEATASNNVSSTTESSVTPSGTFTSDNLPKTNFTCKDKKLEQFYPDPEANCQVFHYCSPGFVKKQVLDLKFLCTGATMFDVSTQKCEDMSSVTCGQEPTPSSVNDTTTTESTATPYNETTTTQVHSNTTSEPAAKNITESDFVTKEHATEALNVTTEVPTTTSTHDTTTETFHVHEITDKETNWNGTKHEHHINATTDESLDTTTATEETVLETTTITEDPQMAETEEKTKIDLPERTTIKATEEPTTVMDQSITEIVTEQAIEDESMVNNTPTSIIGASTQADIEPETATELGPIMHHEAKEETKTITEDDFKVAADEATQSPGVEVTTDSTPATSLDHSVSVLQETSTEVSVSTDVSVSSSSDSISSEASVSSAVPVSQNITTPNSVEPLEKSM